MKLKSELLNYEHFLPLRSHEVNQVGDQRLKPYSQKRSQYEQLPFYQMIYPRVDGNS